jgi:hypothetical protein
MRRVSVVLVLGVVLLLAGGVAPTAGSASPGAMSITWWTVDSGGGTSTAQGYSLSGTTGQSDAGVLAGGDYRLVGGFWGVSLSEWEIYLPLVVCHR